MIAKFLQHLIPFLQEHLTDDRMAGLFCDELSFVDRLTARGHLAMCRYCRLRQGDLQGRRAEEIMDLYRDALKSASLKLPVEPRAAFARRLEVHIDQLSVRRSRASGAPGTALFPLSRPRPFLAMSGLLGSAVIIALVFWWPRRGPEITAGDLLARAEARDSFNPVATVGVAYQSVRITAPNFAMGRTIYRDMEGRRLLKPVKLGAAREQLKAELARAGVNWDEPISASDYQSWHDRQHVRTDKVARVGTHLLRLTTTIPNSAVHEQSLTVRDTDFHPVLRTVDLRNVGTVEIAELDFKILPWSAVDANVFETIRGPSAPAIAGPPLTAPFVKIPVLVTQEQLDASELETRLVLNQLHADSGEQIEIHRDTEKLEVVGVVETEERRHLLQMELRMVPHVKVSLLTVADLKSAPVNGEVTEIRMASMPDHPSPLQTLLKAHGRGVNDGNVLAQRLFNVALTISQESNAIHDLQTRFSPEQQRPIVVTATLAELVYSHRERLEAALRSERALVTETQISPVVRPEPAEPNTSSLVLAAARNMTLSKELIETNSPVTRSAEQILAEMSCSIDDLTIAARDAYVKPQRSSALSGKR